MRLLQLNAWEMRLDYRINQMIDQERPDLIAFQEVFDADYDLGFFATLSEVVEPLGFIYRYVSPVCGVRMSGGVAQFGNAIASKLKLSDQATVFTNLEYTEDFSFEQSDYNVRNFQHVVATGPDGATFHIINHHGYHVPDHKNGNEATLKACKQIADYARGLDGPVIITGDFNLVPESESIGEISRSFRNLTSEYGLSTTRNDLTFKQEPCDYIFVNDLVKVNDFYMSDIVASDHQGLVLDFDLSN